MLHYDLAGFTTVAPGKTANEDRLLLQGELLSAHGHGAVSQTRCQVFVADGVGGTPGGDVAAQQLLEFVQADFPVDRWLDAGAVRARLEAINATLIARLSERSGAVGAATTMVGVRFAPEGFVVVSAGDSELWLAREGAMFRVNETQLISSLEPGSPLASYFGGARTELDLLVGCSLRELRADDVFLLCSDGLMRALAHSQVRSVLSNNRTVQDKCVFLADKVMAEAGRPDDVTFALIECHTRPQKDDDQ